MTQLSKLWRALARALAYEATFRALASLGARRLSAQGAAGGGLFEMAEAAARLADTGRAGR